MVNTRLEIGGLDYATVNDISISTNYVQADIREPDKRNATFTKTIQLYGTSEVNKLFENIYEANVVTQVFNPNKKTPAKYFVNEIEVLRGDLQLLKIKLTPDNNIIYECNILGSEGALFVDIGESFLETLDFSSYNHNYTRANQIASWANAGTGLGYYYGFIDRGSNGGLETTFNTKDFLPQFFVHEYLTKILALKGYTFTSSLLDSNEFKRLVVEPNISVLTMSQAQIDNSQFYVGLSADLVAADGWTYGISLTNKTSPFFDIGNQNVGTYAALNQSGNYNIAATIKTKLRFTHTDPLVTQATASNQQFNISIQKSADNGVNWFSFPVQVSLTWTGQGGTTNVNTDYLMTFSVATGSQPFSAGDRFRVSIGWYRQTPIYYNASNVQVLTGTGTWTMTALSGSTGSSFYALLTDKTVLEGNTLLANNALPKNIKQKDLLKSIMQYANLYIDIPDKNNPKQLIIESYSDYFNNGIVDWENKIDKLKDISVNPISLIDGKKYIFNYKDDKDFYNTTYKGSYSESFGTKLIEIDNDFIKAEKKNELIFSPTPNVANYGLGIAIPKIYQQDPILGVKSVVPNIRLLYAGGTKQTVNPYTFKQSGQVDLITKDYGYCGHTNDSQSPTIDLNFGILKETYYNFIGASFTTNNAYNRFHKPFIETITSRDSKVLIAYLWLTPQDISNFSFRKKYFIKDAYYLVNKIVNYNPMVSESTQCELIKVLDLAAFTPVVTLFTNSPNIPTGGQVSRTSPNGSQRTGNSINLGTNCVAIGEGIFIPSSAKNVTVIGNNVTVAEGVSNVSIINTNDYEVTNSNVTYVNRVIQSSFANDTVITITENTTLTINDSFVNANATSGNITAALPPPASCFINGISKIINVKKIDISGNTVRLTSAVLIDGEVEQFIYRQHDSITVYTDGVNWFIQ